MGDSFEEKINKERKKYYCPLVLAAVLIFAVIFSLSNLTVKPALWFDEGLNIEIAHNFLLFKQLDIATAPGVFSGFRFALGTNGYPLTIPLAGFFGLFGFGLEQARIYMLLWLIAALFSIYYITKSIFNSFSAIAAVLLIASFAPFYGNGLTVMGEVPGFFFLLWGLFFLLKRQSYYWAGLFFGLAAASKPSIHLLLFPALLIFLIFFNRQNFLKRLLQFIKGSLPPLLLWVYFTWPNPFLMSTWVKMLNYYKNPTDVPLLDHVLRNFSLIVSHSTLLYLILIISTIIFAFLIKHDLEKEKRRFTQFVLIYGIFAFLYFLKSSGWLRYFFSFELLSLILLFPAITIIIEWLEKKLPSLFIKMRNLAAGFLVLLILFQTLHLFFNADIQRSDIFKRIAIFINSNKSQATVGLIDLPQLAALIPAEKKYHVMKTMVVPQIGENPLTFSPELLPALIIFRKGGRGEKAFVGPHREILEKNYNLIKEISSYQIFERN